jgi:predicted esterase
MNAPSRNDIREWIAELSIRRGAILFLTVLAVLTFLIGVGFYAYFGVFAHHSPDEVRESVRANPNVSMTEGYGGYIVSNADPDVERLGLVFYPGGRVAPNAYLSTAARIAERADVTVVIPKMSLNLAVFSQERADAVIRNESQISRWVVGGHSLGGAMACRYAGSNADGVEGIVLVGSYCDRPVKDTPTIVVIGTRDAVLDRDQFVASRENLPPDHEISRIEGMNHSQAGWYSGQRGGQEARISTTEAHRRLAIEITDWLCRDLNHCADN